MAEFQEQIKNLSMDEKLELIQELWDSMLSTEPESELAPEEIALLKARAEEAISNPEAGRSWDEVLADLKRDL